jgi:long-chain fatty acid transport protein
MKKRLIIGVLVLCCVPMAFATIVTNANQSALYFRLLSRNASTDIDAVYYNPAGLTRLKDGFHVGLHNQTIFQEKRVINAFPLLNVDTYKGKVNVPIFPNAYLVYKQGPLALSFGFGPNSGGGTADYGTGLPSFEYQIAELPVLLSSMGIPTTKYSANIAFKGESVYYGFQLNASYAIDDMFSVAGGIRYISASNNYTGHIESVMINPNFPAYGLTGQMVSAPQVFTLLGQAAYAAATSNRYVDAKQTGTGWTPILSLNVHPAEGLNISAKYEFNTSLKLTNETTKDDTGMFPDGEITHNDIPAILSFGAEYTLMPQLRAMLSFNYFFDKNANWGGREKLVNSNTYDLGIGLEYDVTKTFTLSAGYLLTQFDLSEAYQEDISHEIPASTLALGARFRLGEKLDLDLGGIYSIYSNGIQKTIDYGVFGSYLEKYERSNVAFAIGLGYHF